MRGNVGKNPLSFLTHVHRLNPRIIFKSEINFLSFISRQLLLAAALHKAKRLLKMFFLYPTKVEESHCRSRNHLGARINLSISAFVSLNYAPRRRGNAPTSEESWEMSSSENMPTQRNAPRCVCQDRLVQGAELRWLLVQNAEEHGATSKQNKPDLHHCGDKC